MLNYIDNTKIRAAYSKKRRRIRGVKFMMGQIIMSQQYGTTLIRRKVRAIVIFIWHNPVFCLSGTPRPPPTPCLFFLSKGGLLFF